MDCIFCKIISKEIPTKILYEDDDTISFLDAFPVAKGHTLVIPKKHHAKIQDLPFDVNQKLFDTVHKITSKVDSEDLAVGRARQRNIQGWVPPTKRK